MKYVQIYEEYVICLCCQLLHLFSYVFIVHVAFALRLHHLPPWRNLCVLGSGQLFISLLPGFGLLSVCRCRSNKDLSHCTRVHLDKYIIISNIYIYYDVQLITIYINIHKVCNTQMHHKCFKVIQSIYIAISDSTALPSSAVPTESHFRRFGFDKKVPSAWPKCEEMPLL